MCDCLISENGGGKFYSLKKRKMIEFVFNGNWTCISIIVLFTGCTTDLLRD
jgi:hypothetical protein